MAGPGLIQGDWGWSFEYQLPVGEVVGSALALTMVVNLATVLFIHIVAIPIAIYSATHRGSVGEHVATFLGYIGVAVPSFLLALALLFYLNRWFGISVGGMMDPRFQGEPWSMAKFGSIAAHLVVPVIVIGLAGTAGMIRRMRANLLDELNKQYTTIPVADTIKRAANGSGTLLPRSVVETVDRSSLWHAQTPQMFRYGLLRDALAVAHRNERVVTDEASAVEALGHRPHIVSGTPRNFKVTTAEDLAMMDLLLRHGRLQA